MSMPKSVIPRVTSGLFAVTAIKWLIASLPKETDWQILNTRTNTTE